MTTTPTPAVSGGPISREEMVELFGEQMPPEAVRLIWEAPPETTFRELRGQLREIAAKVAPAVSDDEVKARGLVEKLIEAAMQREASNRFGGDDAKFASARLVAAEQNLRAELNRITTLEAAVTAFLAAYSYVTDWSDEVTTLRKLMEDGHGG